MNARHKASSKSAAYVQRLLCERPNTTASGSAYVVEKDGWCIRVPSSRAMNGRYAFYNATDYPIVFGWTRPVHMPWPHGTLVWSKKGYPLERCINGKKSGKPASVVSYRLSINYPGTYDYRVSGWNGNYMWASENQLELVELIEEETPMQFVEETEPSLEEKVDAILNHLNIRIERKPSEVVVLENQEEQE